MTLGDDTSQTSPTIHHLQGLPARLLVSVATRAGSCGELATALAAFLMDWSLPDTPSGRALATGDLSTLTPAQQRVLRRHQDLRPSQV